MMMSNPEEIPTISLELEAGFLQAGDMAELPPFLRQDASEARGIAELLGDAERCIRLRTGGTIRELRVVLDNGEVVVTGRTSTFYNKMLATYAALDAAGGKAVTNNIEVNP